MAGTHVNSLRNPIKPPLARATVVAIVDEDYVAWVHPDGQFVTAPVRRDPRMTGVAIGTHVAVTQEMNITALSHARFQPCFHLRHEE